MEKENSSRAQKAKDYFLSGYTCCQSLSAAFYDKTGLDESTVLRLTLGFGAGVGRMREICGAVSGMAFIVSAYYGDSESGNTETKKKIYSYIQELVSQFKKINGSVVCADILGLERGRFSSPSPEKRTDDYYKKRPCAEIVFGAADMLNKFLESHPK